MSRPEFAVVSGAQVRKVLDGREKFVVDVVERAYRLHGTGHTVNPPSYFLRFPDKPEARIIALPASVGGEAAVDGIKWISSFPANTAIDLPRASAVLVLNDHGTGYPFACLESSVISAARTAASAVLAADRLTRHRQRPRRLGFIGTGLIARYVHTYLAATGWEFDTIGLNDLSHDYAERFAGYLRRVGATSEITTHGAVRDVIRASDLVVFATIAGEPHVHDPGLFAHNPLVLHLSLRDLSPEVILSATNIVDDVDHCLKAGTSPHLTEQLIGNRDFVHGTLHDVLTGAVDLAVDRPVVFSPFGLGVLDLAVGRHVHGELAAAGELVTVPGFFADLDRYGQG